MSINDDERTWIESLDPSAISKYDRGRLLHMANRTIDTDPETSCWIRQLLAGETPATPSGTEPQLDLSLYERGAARARNQPNHTIRTY